jgi:hypothetical protein
MCSKFDEFRDVKMISIVLCTIDLEIRQYFLPISLLKNADIVLLLEINVPS